MSFEDRLRLIHKAIPTDVDVFVYAIATAMADLKVSELEAFFTSTLGNYSRRANL